MISRRYNSVAQPSNILEPPGPILALRVRKPRSTIEVEVDCLIDSGADLTAIPSRTVSDLGLVPARTLKVEGFDNAEPEEKPTYYVHLSFNGYSYEFIEITETKSELALLGRDVLNQLIVKLDGKQSVYEVSDP